MRIRVFLGAAALTATTVLGGATASAAPVPPANGPSATHGQQARHQADDDRAHASWRLTYSRATHKVRAVYPGARLVSALGHAPGGPTTNMAKVDHWRFIYEVPPRHRNAKPVMGAYVDAVLGGPVGKPRPGRGAWLDNAPIKGPRLTPAGAYHQLKKAGHRGHAFQFVSLGNPLHPEFKQRWIFSNLRGGCDRYSVDDIDGKVHDLRKRGTSAR
ncbi:hypothetical protein [Streptomyces albofaciens]|uniref:hypothetical protein n=1 Tax=Streptomyces albofaciens TaxID=66866 RepID=UPI00142EC9AE|nr:hypothetical protein [Streptomyces albofaciens]